MLTGLSDPAEEVALVAYAGDVEIARSSRPAKALGYGPLSIGGNQIPERVEYSTGDVWFYATIGQGY